MLSNRSSQAFEIADAVNPTNDKLRSFIRLGRGWYFGEGTNPGQSILSNAISLASLAQLCGWETDAFPGISGEVLVSIERGSEYYEIIFELNGSLTVVYEVDGEEVNRTPDLSFDDVITKISENSVFQCAIYDSFLRTTGTPVRNDSYLWLSETPLQNTAAVYQLLTGTALKNEARPHASIWAGIITNSDFQLSSGKSTRRRSRRTK